MQESPPCSIVSLVLGVADLQDLLLRCFAPVYTAHLQDKILSATTDSDHGRIH